MQHIAFTVIYLVKEVENLLHKVGIIGMLELLHLTNIRIQLYTSLLKRNTAYLCKIVPKLILSL